MANRITIIALAIIAIMQAITMLRIQDRIRYIEQAIGISQPSRIAAERGTETATLAPGTKNPDGQHRLALGQ